MAIKGLEGLIWKSDEDVHLTQRKKCDAKIGSKWGVLALPTLIDTEVNLGSCPNRRQD